MVRALAGDSTITNELAREVGLFLGHVNLGNLGKVDFGQLLISISDLSYAT